MILYVDDCRPAPENAVLCKSVNQAKKTIKQIEKKKLDYIEYIDIDHDAGDYYKDGGDFIELLNWLEETGRNYPIKLHSMNPVGRQNMRRIIQKNGWKEIY